MTLTKPLVFEIESMETASTWPVMRQLRPHLDEQQYLAAVARMRKTDGFRLLAASIDGKLGAVAGFRTMEMLYCGRILSIDDLVTDEAMRSKGLGAALLEWLWREAQALGCGQIHLDSGLQRLDAHRFYERESFRKLGFHFAAPVGPPGTGANCGSAARIGAR
jgi:GNAT superfamily N-acetyltransferase